MTSIINRCRNINSVSRAIARDRRYSSAMSLLRKTKTQEQHLLLSAPATVALCIDESGVQWPSDRPLRLLLLGTKTLEFIDHGQWFRFLSPLFGHTKDLTVTACNSRPGDRKKSVAQLSVKSHGIQTYAYQESVSDVLKVADCMYDLAISFSPLEANQELLDDLAALKQHRVPFYFTSFSSTHALLNHALLRSVGAEASAVVARNPFALVSKRDGENWNRVISKVDVNLLPDSETVIDTDYLDTLSLTATMVLNSHKTGDPSQRWPVGAPVKDGWVHTLDGIAVKPGTPLVFNVTTDEKLGRLQDQWLDVVDSYDETWDETDKLIWASHIRYFAASDGVAPTEHQLAEAS